MTIQIRKQPLYWILLVLLASCSAPQATTSEEPLSKAAIKIDGSSTVFPLTNEIVSELKFEQGEDAPTISVDVSGTGGGFKKFCAGETAINNASRPILKAEMETCKANGVEYIEIPVAFDALTVVVHPENDWVDNITVAELNAIWEPAAEGVITQWSQVREGWPDRPLNLHGADVESGTYDYFTEAIVGESKASRSDYTAQADDDLIVRAVRQDTDALGFFGYAYFSENSQQLNAVAIDAGNGPVLPSEETVQSGEYQPLTRPLFIYVSADAAESNPELASFVEYYLNNVRFLTEVVGYVPLPNEVYNLAFEHFTDKRIGTAFGGEAPTNLTIEALVKVEREF
ncbi:phosphate ABC transporter substrate-binding protein, PhoT family [Leptolyngbya sp. PCC 7375]|nr:phosphate ABC transporter substrate-binding protein, PhoT family [Leptolyngbya sp. PCC 7375]